MPSVATAFDVARLYDELRECVRANDQEGVKRVFGELVAARRPVAEILAEVKSLTKEREKAEAEAKPETETKSSFTREWPVTTASSQPRPSAPAPTYQNIAPASEPPPSAPQRPSPPAAIPTPAAEKPASAPAPQLWRQPAPEPPPRIFEQALTPEPPPRIFEPAPIPEPPRSP
jgi:hypothetical protein